MWCSFFELNSGLYIGSIVLFGILKMMLMLSFFSDWMIVCVLVSCCSVICFG